VSDAPDPAKLSELRQWLLEEWSNALGQSIESMTGERVAFHASEPPFDAGESAVSWEETLSIGAEHTILVSFPGDAWNATGRGALVAIGLEDPDVASIRGTFLEIVRQATSVVIRSIGAKIGREVTSLEGREAGPVDSGTLIRVEGVLNGEALTHGIVFSPALVAALLPLSGGDKPPAAAERPASLMVADPGYPRTLELLLDVELPVSVSFGRAQVPLKEVLKLTSGSIVELNRTISEPVEVIVNNCVIARGEVVVVEGNYGIRINHIVNRQERLRTLH
jgi:flagellar motor switch protein FliN/FliY